MQPFAKSLTVEYLIIFCGIKVKIIDSKGPSTDHYGTPEATGKVEDCRKFLYHYACWRAAH